MAANSSVPIVFSFPPAFNRPIFPHHLGMAYIQAFLARYGIHSLQINPLAGMTLHEYAERLIEADAPIVGFSCYDTNYFLIRSLAAMIKRKRSSTVVIIGGPSATFSDDLVLTCIPEIDIAVRFEGEETTLELVSHIIEGRPLDSLDKISGISLRRGHSVVKTPDRPLFLSRNCGDSPLDALPSPYLEGILDGTQGTGLITARGCIHRCTYCNFAAMSRHTIRFHSIDRVIAELKVIQSSFDEKYSDLQQARAIQIHDDAFSLNLKRAKKICKRIIDEGIKLDLCCMCRADNIDEEFITLLKKAGFKSISFGLESGVPEILRNIKKVCSIPPKKHGEKYLPEKQFLLKVRQGIDMAKRHDMKTAVSIILGLPGETLDQGRQTIEFVKTLNVDSYVQNYLAAMPGTELFERAGHYGIKVELSGLTLPHKTIHSYPVEKVPYLDNSSCVRDRRSMIQSIMRPFAGIRVSRPEMGKGIVLALIEAGNSNAYSRILQWTANYLALDGKIITLVKSDTLVDEIDRMKEVFYHTPFQPAYKCVFLKDVSNSKKMVIYGKIGEDFFSQRFQLPVVQFRKYLEFMDGLSNKNIENFPIYCINEKSDIRILSAMAETLARELNSGNNASATWLKGVFLDGCRWSRSVCPAVDFTQVIIDESGEIRPCFAGQSMGGLHNSIQELRENAWHIYDNLRRERKCDECPADSRCAKCLFPFPFSSQEYCEINRCLPDVGVMVMSTNLANTIYSLNF